MDTFFSIYEEYIDGVFVCYADVSELDLSKAEVYLSEYRKSRVNSLRRIEDKKCSAGGELLLIHGIKKLYPKMSIPLDITAGQHGKPQICGDIYFNISHSGKVAVCAIASTPVGVDVERTDRQSEGVAKRCFTAAEMKMARSHGFAAVWTRKEAAAKADGGGIAIGLEMLDVSRDVVRIGENSYQLKSLDIKISGYAAALCVKWASESIR